MISIDSLFIIGLALFGLWTSYRLGRIKGRALERQARSISSPVCPCGHIWGAHKEGGACNAQRRRPHYTSYGERVGHEYVRCDCLKYHGPTLITEDFFVPGITSGES